jgi:hypothetical protein
MSNSEEVRSSTEKVWQNQTNKDLFVCKENGIDHSPVLIIRYNNTYKRFGPGIWAFNAATTLSRHLGLTKFHYKDSAITQQDLLVYKKCGICGILYQMPQFYTDDFETTHGKITEIAPKLYMSVFALEWLWKHPKEMNHTHLLMDNEPQYDRCELRKKELKEKNVWIRCYLSRQCINPVFPQMPKRARKAPLIYLKAHSRISWNDTVVNALKERAHKTHNYSDIHVFQYGSYDRSDFLKAASYSPWAIVFSPSETFGWFHVELRSYNVPLFVLRPEAVNLFSNKSGVVIDDRKFTLPDIVTEFDLFLSRLEHFRPFQEIQDHNLMLPDCAKSIQKLSHFCFSEISQIL